MHRLFSGAAIAGAVVAGVMLAGCGSSSSGSPPVKTAAVPSTKAPVPVAAEPAGPNPSRSAQMVCAEEAQKDIAQALGITPTQVTTPTWVDHVYSCQYVYPNAVITLSVKELSSAAETRAYFDGLGTALGRRSVSIELGDGAFRTRNGSVVARKDYKVLEIDVARVPAQFGRFDLPPARVALNVAATLIGCWTGA